MSRPAALPQTNRFALTLWLAVLTGLVFAMILVGGATRMTGSGLSITEWRPIAGALPPLSLAEWLAEFEKYRQISQYELLNKGMSLAEFQAIYWWEWGHRQLGRFIGLVYAVGLAIFLLRGDLRGRAAVYFVGCGLLLGTQGAVGWIMVASGLEPGMTAVAPVKLMLHLLLASLFFAAMVAPLAQRLAAPVAAPASIRRDAVALAGFILLQIALGALVAGSRSGLSYNTWPLMDGLILPPWEALTIVRPMIENLVDNPLTVQFNHRLLAYALVAFALWQAWRVRGTAAGQGAGLVAGLALAQMVLGIVTLLLAVPLWAGLAHQGLAEFLFAASVWQAARLRAA